MDERGGEGLSRDGRAEGLPRRDEHVDLAVGVGEEERVRDATQEVGGFVPFVRDEEVGVVD